MKSIPSAVLSISFVLLLASAGTWASYTDVETSSGNALTAGTMDLYMEDDDEDISEEWTYTGMIPGKSTEIGELNLYNKGVTPADHVEILFSTTCRDPKAEAGENEDSDTLDGASGMDSYMKVDSISYSPHTGGNIQYLVLNGISQNPSISDSTTDQNTYIDLADLNGITLDNLEPPGTLMQNPRDFGMQVSFDESAPNDYQGDECTLTLTFTMNQDASE